MMQTLHSLAKTALKEYGKETQDLHDIAKTRQDRSIWPTGGQYEWFCVQLLYCLVRKLKPELMVEVATSSGYSTVITGMAMKRNGRGTLHTFELVEPVAKAAQKNFERFKVDAQIQLHVGDAQQEIKKVAHLEKTSICFLDGLHDAWFFRWFCKAVVQQASDHALFHVHDVLPRDARVRFIDTPGRNPIMDFKKWVSDWPLGKGLPKRIYPTVMAPTQPGELPYMDGNWNEEAVLVNLLADSIPEQEKLYAHRWAEMYLKQGSRDFDSQSVEHRDSFGKPFEWNDAFWCKAGAMKKSFAAFHKDKI
jgi:hypothetical protein